MAVQFVLDYRVISAKRLIEIILLYFCDDETFFNVDRIILFFLSLFCHVLLLCASIDTDLGHGPHPDTSM